MPTDIWIWVGAAVATIILTGITFRGERKQRTYEEHEPLQRSCVRVLDDVPYNWKQSGL